MHLAIVVHSGKIDKVIYYGFSNENPTTSNLLSYKKDTTKSVVLYLNINFYSIALFNKFITGRTPLAEYML